MLAGFVMFDRVSGWLDQFAVHPLAFGSGIAHELMEEAKQLSPGYLQLDVNADNERALAFYEREGFRRVGEGTNPNSGARTLTMEWRDAPNSDGLTGLAKAAMSAPTSSEQVSWQQQHSTALASPPNRARPSSSLSSCTAMARTATT